MVKLIKKEWHSGNVLCEYICDSESDIETLPTFATNEIGAGSTCICTEDSSVHILGADDKWHKL